MFKNKFFRFLLYIMQCFIPFLFPSHNIDIAPSQSNLFLCTEYLEWKTIKQLTKSVVVRKSCPSYQGLSKMCLIWSLQISAKHLVHWLSTGLIRSPSSVCFPNISCKHIVSSSHSAVPMHLQAPILLFRIDTTRSLDHFSTLKHERRRIMWNWS